MTSTATVADTATTQELQRDSDKKTGLLQTFRLRFPLAAYICKRFIISVFLVFGVTLVTFILTNLVPANPVNAILGEQEANDPQAVARMEAKLGLDKPLWEQ